MRISCSVPFCKRRRGLRKGEAALPSEWICPVHWRMVSSQTKRRYRRCRQLLHRRPNQSIHLSRMVERFWDKAKTEAIETGMGIRG